MNLLRFRTSSSPDNNQDSVQRVLLANLHSLYSTAYRLSGDADLAEDLVQETARRALQGMPGLQHERNIRAWLFKILVNTLKDHIRHTQFWDTLDRADEQLEMTVDPESLSQAAVQDVRKALTQLTPAHRVMVVLIDIEEFTLVEAAEMLRIPIGTVASRLARARLELRQLLQVYQSKASQSRGPS